MIYSLFQLLSLFDIIVILGCSFLYGLPGVRWDLFELVIYPRYYYAQLPYHSDLDDKNSFYSIIDAPQGVTGVSKNLEDQTEDHFGKLER